MKKIYSFFVLVFALASCTPKDRWAQIMESYLPNDSVAQLLLVKHTEGSNAIAEFYLKENGTWQLVGKNPVFIGENAKLGYFLGHFLGHGFIVAPSNCNVA